MVWWHELKDISLPIRFQIPRGYCEYGKSQYNQLTLGISDETFLEWFKNVENTLIVTPGPIDTRVKEKTLTVKYVDGFSQVFDSSDVLMVDGHSFIECEMDCLVEIDKVYSLNGNQGVTCKIFQVRVIPHIVCMFH